MGIQLAGIPNGYCMACIIKGIYIIAYPELSKKTDFEVRILSTRIVLAIIGALALWMLIVIYIK